MPEKKKAVNLFAKHKKTGWDPFDRYRVEVRVGHLVGGLPMTTKLVESWVNATNKDKKAEDREAIRGAHVDTLPETVDEKKEKQGIGFARVDGQLCVEGRCLKAMLKEAANIIKDSCPSNSAVNESTGTGIAGLKAKVADQVFVSEEYIPLGRTEPDRIVERPIHVMTPQGARDSIKVCEVCDDVVIKFTVRRHKGMKKQAVPEKTLLAIVDYAQNVGLGADRSQGYGTFEVLSVVKDD